MPRAARLAFGLVLASAMLLGGCARPGPHELRVSAIDAADFADWQRSARGRFAEEQWREFEAMVREIKVRAAQTSPKSGATRADAWCAMLHGRTCREILLLGYDLKRQALEAEGDELRHAIRTNAWLVTRPGDRESATFLREFRGRQERRLGTIARELDVVDRRVVALGGTAPGVAGAARTVAENPPPLAREEAMSHIATLIHEFRSAAMLKHGSYPALIDRQGNRLADAERAEFVALQAEARRSGEIVIPVRLKQRWWFYRAPEKTPELPSFVSANLTPADRQQVVRDWCDLEAELWARRVAVED